MSNRLKTQGRRLPRVVREGPRVYLESVRCMRSPDCPSRTNGALASAMRALGEEITYEELVGSGALAFRMQVHPGFCPSTPHAQCGWPCVQGSLDALPWHTQHYRTGDLKPDRPSDAEQIRTVRRAVTDSIDRGIPVQYGDIEDGLIVGYQAGGNEWICYHPLRDEGDRPYAEKGLSWGILLFTERKDPPPARRPIADAALRQAVAMWHEEHCPDATRNDFMGRAAWTYWIDTLPQLPDKEQEGAKYSRHGSAWIYHALVNYRRCAAAYLRLVAPEFPAAAATHLHHAADDYDHLANRALTDPDHNADAIAPYWEPWPESLRTEQLRRLRMAAEFDGKAIAAIEAALAAL